MSEEDEAVQQSKMKTVVFTIEERKLLLKLVNMHFDVLNNNKIDSTSIRLKNQAWEAIHKKYIENTGLVQMQRTPQQLRRCWENMRARAKKGNPMSVKLLRWGEMQYKMMVNGKNSNNEEEMVLESSSLVENGVENSDLKIREENDCNENQSKPEEIHSRSSEILKDFSNSIKLLENTKCIHCTCDKAEKKAKIDLLILQQQQSEELHQLQIQIAKDKMNHEKELQKLYVHEMTLKIENERRRAEILDRELNI